MVLCLQACSVCGTLCIMTDCYFSPLSAFGCFFHKNGNGKLLGRGGGGAAGLGLRACYSKERKRDGAIWSEGRGNEMRKWEGWRE